MTTKYYDSYFDPRPWVLAGLQLQFPSPYPVILVIPTTQHFPITLLVIAYSFTHFVSSF